MNVRIKKQAMNSLFRSLTLSRNAREEAIKESLITNLNENAREIQYESQEQQGTDCVGLAESTTSLCTTVEAIFLHGLKDSLLWHTISVIGSDVDRRPEPSFWTPLLVFLHKQTIEQIQGLSQITTEVGSCRTWVRISLNEACLSSYLNNIRKNNSALNPYYKRHAMLRDIDCLDVAAKILEGIEAGVQINLPVNSTLLNRWADFSLQLAGIWTPPLRSCLIANGIDVASSLSNEAEPIPMPKPLQCNELYSDSISNSPFTLAAFHSNSDLTDQEHFQIFLSKVKEIQEGADAIENLESSNVVQGKTESPERDVREPIVGNSLSSRRCWTGTDLEISKDSAISVETNDDASRFCRSTSMTPSISSQKSPLDHHSYNTLLNRHRKTRELDWNDVWERFENSVGITGNDGSFSPSEASTGGNRLMQVVDDVEAASFEILSASLSDNFTKTELQEMVEHACKLSRELGLDSQGFVCKSCAHPLGIGFAIAQVCAFTGQYYCEKCMHPDPMTIPARVAYNWDFRKYPVSKKAFTFITEFQYQPFIDFKLLNPDVYSACDEMAVLQSLRIQLNFIRAYLFTCCQPIINDLQKQMWSREYLYEYIHRYSMSDLMTMQRGTLAQLLQRTVQFGEQHILVCPLCSVKGFICEICNSSKVLYPFHLDTTYRCSTCGAVFHDQCLNNLQPCPKCERRRKREDLPLFEAVHAL